MFDTTIYTFFYYFIIYSFMGWCLETVYATINKREFVNRGFLNGPFCPIYGAGILSIIIFLKPIESNYLLLFLGSIFLTSFIEYLTGYVLETAFNSTWWDYSDQPYNLHGRVCLSFSIIWGFVSLLILKVIHPYILHIVSLIPSKPGLIIFDFMLLYLFIDFIFTILTIFKLKSHLHQLNKVYLDLADKVSDFKLNLGNTKNIPELKVKLDQLIESAEIKMSKKKIDIENIIKELKTRYEYLFTKKYSGYSRIINAFPDLRFKGLDIIIKDVKNRIRIGKKS
jgi:uncharacterized membrane protein